MTSSQGAAGCRDTTFVTGFLLAIAIVFFAAGLTLVNQESCGGACETIGLTLLYAGGPVSAVFGILTDSVVVAWPLDITLWVVTGFLVARHHDRRGRPLWGMALVVVGVTLIYGLVLSQFVDLTV